MVFVVHVLKFI